MSDNPNKTIIVVVAALAVILVLLLANAGSCSRSGGMGGGASAPAASTAGSASTAASASTSASASVPTSASVSTSSAQSQAAGSAAASAAGATVSATASSSQEITIDQALSAIQATQAQVGSNARPASSATLATTAQAYSGLSARGLDSVQLTSDFDADGAYLGYVDLQASSSEAYPSYQGLYHSANDVYWVIFVNEGKYYASPVATSAAAISKDVILSEAGTVTQYDALANQFSDFSLQELEASGTHAVQVAAIDQATLDSYTASQIEAM